MRIFAVITILAAFLAVSPAYAEDPINIQILSVEEQAGRIAATVNIVGADGRPIAGLGVPNFKGTLGETPIVVSDLLGSNVTRQPAHIVLVVDISGSMRGEAISQAKAAMQDFVRTLDPGDKVAIVLFGPTVIPLQEFTADRSTLNRAITSIAVNGETALYDGVIEGVRKISEAPPGRRSVVLLSDGSATINLGTRAASLEAAAATGVGVTALGFGQEIDRAYLNELATVSGGRFLQANANSLRQLYADIANAIRSQYTVVMSVPSTFDRTVPVKLKVQVTLRTDSAVAERGLGPLPGAVIPPFDLKVSGLAAGQKIPTSGVFNLTPQVGGGTSLAMVEYFLDGTQLANLSNAPFAYDLDSAALSIGSHIINVTATDMSGRMGQAQIAFTVVAPAKSSPISIKTILILVLAGAVSFGAYTVIKKKRGRLKGIASRVRPFARRSDEPLRQPIDGWPTPVPAPQPMPPPVDRILGRVVVMDEAAVRNGNLDAIREYEIRAQPLILGTGESSDIRLVDEQGRIAAEEARLWVQKGRLVYHKLTTLSAMATEGVTSGWEFLETGEEMRLGAYRLLFEEYTEDRTPYEEPEPASPEEPLRPTQEHGMTLSDLWSRVAEDIHLRQPSD
ncbi:MAG TPA: VWA domain-containing protein [Dehalococcoidia bacterium]|nr:VWA domain-containing protein [Dehalococcoidia bacterium]